MFDYLQDLKYVDYREFFKAVLVFFILFGSIILKLLDGQKSRFGRNDRNILIVYVTFLILFAGSRHNTLGTDTGNYYSFFFIPSTHVDFFGVFSLLKTDLLFEVLLTLTAWTGNYNVFLLLVAFVLNVSLYLFVRKFTEYSLKGSSLLLFLTIACSFSFLSLELNIIRNALSIGFVLLSLNYAIEEKYRKCLLLLLIAFLFHRTAIILTIVIITLFFSKKIHLKYFIAFYLMVIALSFAGFGFHTFSFLASFGNEDLQSLSYSGETLYKIGFRIDFVAYNTFFLILFLKFSDIKSIKNTFLLKYYILTSAIFFLNFYIPFSDRFGLFSWLVIPLLLYNVVSEKFPNKRLYVSTVILFLFYTLNYVILFP